MSLALKPNFVILYVDSPLASADFYADLLGRPPIEAAPTFVMFSLLGETMLGLWSRHTVQPASNVTGGGTEIAFSVADAAAVDHTFAAWRDKGLAILQPPTQMDFGYTFTAQDPDGHRLRVMATPQ